MEEMIMNRYTLFIQTNFGNEYDEWKFIVITDDNRQYVEDVINEYKHMYESPVELMDYLCDTFGWKWEDYEPGFDITIKM